ncbi:pantoate--beta-alanine ligase [Echinicola strongylocentroti]|uniref:Pantothenate synthetase n=1 Tax=Echinicola strongylocentroti TaxID=1795355 RepID=A0A2Z4IL21_9BACT|nr:pantoate--beta-alanine ligase [Echinicola strongylocentroti]AWW31073.1 pantoate--beta-alanine ligase [Echinicola strongylocentroti]
MKILKTKQEVKQQLFAHRKAGQSIGLVPTMGALHEGHLKLVKNAMSATDIVVVSIFVNPTQFNNPADLEKYPRTVAGDLDLLEKEEVDYVFLPEVEEMYPQPTALTVDFGNLERILEGAFRPGHFNGVGVVVSKLFHIVQPDKAFFGQKDLQQVAIIRRMVEDLSFGVEMVVIPTCREKDGLAMSSRNGRLSAIDRQRAVILYDSLVQARKELLAGKSWFEVQKEISHKFNEEPGVKLEYFELVRTNSLEMISEIDLKAPMEGQKSSICTAAFVGDVRLIDNLSI